MSGDIDLLEGFKDLGTFHYVRLSFEFIEIRGEKALSNRSRRLPLFRRRCAQ